MENLYLGDRQSLEAARSELAAVQVKNERQQNKVHHKMIKFDLIDYMR